MKTRRQTQTEQELLNTVGDKRTLDSESEVSEKKRSRPNIKSKLKDKQLTDVNAVNLLKKKLNKKFLTDHEYASDSDSYYTSDSEMDDFIVSDSEVFSDESSYESSYDSDVCINEPRSTRSFTLSEILHKSSERLKNGLGEALTRQLENMDYEGTEESLYSEGDDIRLDEESDPEDHISVRKHKWSEGISLDEKKKYALEVEKLTKSIDNDAPTVDKLMKTHMSEKERKKLLNSYNIMRNMHKYSSEYVALRDEISELLRNYQNMKSEDLEMSGDDIKEKLEKFDKIEEELMLSVSSKIPMKYKIMSLQTDMDNKSVIYDRYQKLQSMDFTNSEYSKLKELIDIAVKLPYNKISELPVTLNDTSFMINQHLKYIKAGIQEDVYGMEQVISVILCNYNDRICNPSGSNGILTLKGHPGVGKTAILMSLAKHIKLPFAHISLNGVHDSAYIEGHGYTYEGAKPGCIVSKLKKMPYSNGIILFDEIDKTESKNNNASGVDSSLLSIFDPEQNHIFEDKYLDEIKIDLSRIWFFCSLNDEHRLSEPLKQRLFPIIHVPGYTTKDKVEIAKKIVPKLLKNVHLEKLVKFTEDAFKKVLSMSKVEEKGVRQFKANLKTIIQRINILRTAVIPEKETGETSEKVVTRENVTMENVNMENVWTLGDLKLSFKKPKMFVPPTEQAPLIVTDELVTELFEEFDEKVSKPYHRYIS